MQTRHRFSSIASIAMLAIVGGIGAPVHAEPIAVWLNPWQVTLGPVNTRGDASAMRAFGMDATMDGEIQDIGVAGEALSGTSAYGKAQATVHQTNQTVGASANTNLGFTRDFRLSGALHGWNVTLSSLLTGELSADTMGIGGAAEVFAPVLLGSHTILHEQRVMNTHLLINSSRHLLLHLPDGDYRVQAHLAVSAVIGSSPSLSGSADSDFFGPGFHHSVAVAAVPVPEPGSLLLLCSGLPLARALIRTRRKDR